MVQYAVLIFERETSGGLTDLSPEEMRVREELDLRITERGGRIVAGLALEPTATATTIRDHGQLVTDGPFMETKEALAGMFIMEARDLDHALELGKLAASVHGTVEVRPLLGFQVLETG